MGQEVCRTDLRIFIKQCEVPSSIVWSDFCSRGLLQVNTGEKAQVTVLVNVWYCVWQSCRWAVTVYHQGNWYNIHSENRCSGDLWRTNLGNIVHSFCEWLEYMVTYFMKGKLENYISVKLKHISNMGSRLAQSWNVFPIWEVC